MGKLATIRMLVTCTFIIIDSRADAERREFFTRNWRSVMKDTQSFGTHSQHPSMNITAKLSGLRQSEVELDSRISMQQAEIDRLQAMVNSLTSEEVELHHEDTESADDDLGQDELRSHLEGLGQPQTELQAPESWSCFFRMDSESDEKAPVDRSSGLSDKMTDLEEAIAGGETQLERARKTIERLIRRDFAPKRPQLRIYPGPTAQSQHNASQRPQSSAHVELETQRQRQIDGLLVTQGELQAQLVSTIEESGQLKRQVHDLESIAAGQKQLDHQMQQMREHQEAQHDLFISERNELLEKIGDAHSAHNQMRGELVDAEQKIVQQQELVTRSEAARAEVETRLQEAIDQAAQVEEELNQSEAALEEFRRRVEAESAQTAEEHVRLESDLAAAVSEKETAMSAKEIAFAELEAAVSDTEVALSAKEAAISEKDAALAEKEAAISDKTQIEAQLQVQATELETQAKELETRTNELNTQAEDLAARTESDAKTKEALQREQQTVKGLVDRLTILRQNHEGLLAECSDKANRIQAMITHSKLLGESESQKSTALTAQTAELLRLRSEHESLQKRSQVQLDQAESLMEEKNRLDSEAEEQADKLVAKQNQITRLRSKLRRLYVNSRHQQHQIKSLAEERDSLAEEREVVRTELEQTSSHLVARSADVSRMRGVNSRMNERAQTQSQTILGLCGEKKELVALSNEQLAVIEAHKMQLAELRATHEKLTAEADNQTGQIRSLTAEKEQIAAASKEKSDSIARFQTELQDLRTSQHSLQEHSNAQTACVEGLIDEKERLTAEVKSQAEALTRQQYALEELQAAHQELLKATAEQADRIACLISEKEHLISQMETLVADKDRLVDENTRLAEEKRQLNDYANKITSEAERLAAENEQLESISQANLRAAAQDYESLEAEKSELQSRLRLYQPPAEEEQVDTISMERHVVQDSSLKDDLTRIEGIGPKIASLLAEKSIVTYRMLANTPASRLKRILEAAGSTFRTHDPSTWPEQAKLAANGDWEELVLLQDDLKGGRRVA